MILLSFPKAYAISIFFRRTILEYVWGALAGLAFGGLAGVIKYFALWRSTINSPEDSSIAPSSVYTRMIISNIVNVAVLAAVFALRNHIPFDYVAALLGAAAGLSLAGKLAPMTKVTARVHKE